MKSNYGSDRTWRSNIEEYTYIYIYVIIVYFQVYLHTLSFVTWILNIWRIWQNLHTRSTDIWKSKAPWLLRHISVSDSDPGGNTDAYREMRIAWTWGRYTVNPTHRHISRDLCVALWEKYSRIAGRLNWKVSLSPIVINFQVVCDIVYKVLYISGWLPRFSVIKSRSLGWRDGAQQNLPTMMIMTMVNRTDSHTPPQS